MGKTAERMDPGLRERGKRSVPLPGLTKAELMRQARMLDIKGRSAMDKAELANAIRLARH
jgi:hypothetical protein